VDEVLKAAASDPNDIGIQRQFFMTGAGGTGKTFTYNVSVLLRLILLLIFKTIIAGMKARGMRVLATATTGIAATLLSDGTTVHMRFNVPNNVDHDTPSRIDRHSHYAAVLDAAQLLIIDEVSMQDRYVLEYVDRLLRSISPHHKDLPFGGKAIVISGDWKQLMPVIPGATEEMQFERSVKSSKLYR